MLQLFVLIFEISIFWRSFLQWTIFLKSLYDLINLFSLWCHLIKFFFKYVNKKEYNFNLIFDFLHIFRLYFKVYLFQKITYFLSQLFHLLTSLKVQKLLHFFYLHIYFTYLCSNHFRNSFQTSQSSEFVIQKFTFHNISLIFLSVHLCHHLLMFKCFCDVHRFLIPFLDGQPSWTWNASFANFDSLHIIVLYGSHAILHWFRLNFNNTASAFKLITLNEKSSRSPIRDL